MPDHRHKTVCECGKVISQCRCIGPHEVTVLSPCTHRPKPLREKRIILVCVNVRCQHFGLRRSIAWPYLGNDIFYKPDFVCVCGTSPREEEEFSNGSRRNSRDGQGSRL